MGQLTSQRLGSRLLAIFLVQVLWLHNQSFAQQLYNLTGNGYSCSDTGKKTCNAFALYRAQPGYSDIPSIATLFNVEASAIADLNRLEVNQSLFAAEPVLLPLTCGCYNNASYANLTYTMLIGDSFSAVNAGAFEYLSTAPAVTDANSNLDANDIQPPQMVAFPVFCACPSTTQISEGVTALVTYPIARGDTVDQIAPLFGVASADIAKANELNAQLAIFYQQTILIPTNTSQPFYNFTPPILPGKRG